MIKRKNGHSGKRKRKRDDKCHPPSQDLALHFFLPLGDKVYTLPFLVIKTRLPLFFMKAADLIPEYLLLLLIPFQVNEPLVSLYLLQTVDKVVLGQQS